MLFLTSPMAFTGIEPMTIDYGFTKPNTITMTYMTITMTNIS